MASYWASWTDYCDATVQSLVPSSLANALPWTATNSRVTDALAHINPYPPLPSEVILRILAFTLPAPSYTHAHERTRLLKQYALFCRDCARWATLLLRRDVACTSVDATTSFLRWAVGPAKDSRGGLLVQSVRFGTGGTKSKASDTVWDRHDSFNAVRHAAIHCPKLSELWLSGMDQLEHKVLRYTKNLRSLYVHEIRLFPLPLADTWPIHLSNLTTLHLSAILAAGPSFSQLLSPKTLPSLRHLDLISVHRSLIPFEEVQQHAAMYQNDPAIPALGGTGAASITASLASLSPPSSSSSSAATPSHPLLSIAPQLHSLTLGPHPTRTLPLSLFPPLFSLSTSLTLLSLPLPTLLSTEFAHLCLPPSLALLRLTKDPSALTAHSSPEALFELETEWRSSAFDSALPDLDLEGKGVSLEVAFEDRLARRKLWEVRRRGEEVRKGRERAVEELRHLGGRGRRYLVLPGGLSDGGREADEYGGTGAELQEIVRLKDGGEVVIFSEDPAQERKDGAFRLGTERWRRFVERPCPDSLL
ncbi:hypothetical protein NBRC10512_000310 [Rhodotorula toruloides]|uniref:RHTO0S11e00408g1_1 n=2 Tax=Rhodotorula toruloides TaxID=5286 RepID=A0A061B666_RHOTO|nr:uncharacterized protein RHTO_03775 [Rhodotorula toruloides NP11]EMS19977.1 hypothetical protein RHTO_03775 [Rhodotorula toruloides NP11]CDR45456.1 RHTO0S11e00408g1_1 [Rhodotorula toruloides]